MYFCKDICDLAMKGNEAAVIIFGDLLFNGQ